MYLCVCLSKVDRLTLSFVNQEAPTCLTREYEIWAVVSLSKPSSYVYIFCL